MDTAYQGHDDRQPQQEQFRAKSPEYMTAFWRYSEDPTKDNLARLMSFSKTQKVHCPRCNARMTDGQCWQGCFNESAIESQRQVNAAIRAAYEKQRDFAEFVARCDEESAGCKADEKMAQDMRHPTF